VTPVYPCATTADQFWRGGGVIARVQYNRRQDAAQKAASINQSNAEALEWLSVFERQAGRKLRVLHIGNIANNAYNNAKIQRARGIDADVLCYDYYHIMGTPEWEDADIQGQLDNFHPDWWSVDLGEWQRPDWFVQGPLLDCLDYLRAKHRGTAADRRRARRSLIDAYWTILDQRATATGRQRPWRDSLGWPAVRTTLKLAPELKPAGRSLREKTQISWSDFVSPHFARLADRAALQRAARDARMAFVDPSIQRQMRGEPLSALDKACIATFQAWRNRSGIGGQLEPMPIEGRDMMPGVTAADAFRRAARLALHATGWAAGTAFSKVVPQTQTPRSSVAAASAVDDATEKRRRDVRAHYRRSFSDVAVDAVSSEVIHADCLTGHFADVMAHYDIVQGYSTDGLTPLFAGVTRFCAYEHGTIREIPFENNLQGRLCRFTYRHAPRVFITNSDVLPSIPRIGIPPHRITYLPHAFNDAKLRKYRDDNPDLQPPAGPPVIFSPTRHHWQSGGGSWTKGNDVLLKAAGLLHARGRKFRLRLVSWGQEVEQSKALIAELGYEHMVEWVPTMTKRQLWAAYCQSHVIADQFTLPALGGVAFETLSLGRRLLTRIDEATLDHFFGAAPPLLNAATPEEVAEQLVRVLDDPDDRKGLGLKARQWIEVFHSSTRVVALQARAYRDLMHDEDAPDIPDSK
jgi:glycosyltransferase involved in cell wall biosynthesis